MRTDPYPALTRSAHCLPHRLRVAGVIAARDVCGRNQVQQCGVAQETRTAESLAEVRVQINRGLPYVYYFLFALDFIGFASTTDQS